MSRIDWKAAGQQLKLMGGKLSVGGNLGTMLRSVPKLKLAQKFAYGSIATIVISLWLATPLHDAIRMDRTEMEVAAMRRKQMERQQQQKPPMD